MENDLVLPKLKRKSFFQGIRLQDFSNLNLKAIIKKIGGFSNDQNHV